MPPAHGKLLTVANYVMAALFLISAAIQFNDPDPLRWMLMYGAAGLACLLASRPSPAWPPPALVGLTALIWAGIMAPSALPNIRLAHLMRSMEDKTPAIEQSRELLGLLIVAAWMGVLWWLALRNKSQH